MGMDIECGGAWIGAVYLVYNRDLASSRNSVPRWLLIYMWKQIQFATPSFSLVVFGSATGYVSSTGDEIVTS